MRTISLLLILFTSITLAAPASFPRKAKSLREKVVGTWKVQWANISCTLTFSQDGSYRCVWPGCNYEGGWGLEKDQLWISESMMVNPRIWGRFVLKMNPRTLHGKLVQVPPGYAGGLGGIVKFEKKLTTSELSPR